MEFNKPNTASAPEQGGDHNPFVEPHPLEMDDVPAFRGESKSNQDAEQLERTVGRVRAEGEIHYWVPETDLINGSAQLEQVSRKGYDGADLSPDELEFLYGVHEPLFALNAEDEQEDPRIAELRQEYNMNYFLGHGARLTSRAFRNFSPDEVFENWDKAKKCFYLGPDSKEDQYAEKYGDTDDWGEVAPEDIGVITAQIGSDAEFAQIVFDNFSRDYAEAYWHEFAKRGGDMEVITSRLSGAGMRQVFENLDKCPDQAISPEMLNGLVSDRLLESFRAGVRGEDRRGCKLYYYDTPTSDTLSSLLGHGVNPNMLADILMGKDKVHGGRHHDAIESGYGNDLVMAHLDLLAEHDLDLNQLSKQMLYLPQVRPGDISTLQDFGAYAPALIQKGANALEIFTWAQPMAEQAHKNNYGINPHYWQYYYHNEVEDAFAKSLDTAAQRHEVNNEMLDFILPDNTGRGVARRIIRNFPALAENPQVDLSREIHSLASAGYGVELTDNFGQILECGVDPSDAGMAIMSTTPRSIDQIITNLAQRGVSVNINEVAQRMSAPLAAKCINNLERHGAHIDANELVLRWPREYSDTARVIQENFDNLVAHGLTEDGYKAIYDRPAYEQPEDLTRILSVCFATRKED